VQQGLSPLDHHLMNGLIERRAQLLVLLDPAAPSATGLNDLVETGLRLERDERHRRALRPTLHRQTVRVQGGGRSIHRTIATVVKNNGQDR
jgi:hypothetical protein